MKYYVGRPCKHKKRVSHDGSPVIYVQSPQKGINYTL